MKINNSIASAAPAMLLISLFAVQAQSVVVSVLVFFAWVAFLKGEAA